MLRADGTLSQGSEIDPDLRLPVHGLDSSRPTAASDVWTETGRQCSDSQPASWSEPPPLIRARERKNTKAMDGGPCLHGLGFAEDQERAKFLATLKESQTRIEADIEKTMQMVTKIHGVLSDGRTGTNLINARSSDSMGSSLSRMHPTLSRSTKASFTYKSQGSHHATEGNDMVPMATELERGFVATTLPLYWPSSLPQRTRHSSTANVFGYRQALAEARHTVETALADSDSASRFSGWEVFEVTKLHRFNQLVKSVRDPTSVLSICAELIGVVVLVFDLITVPYMLGWGIPYEGSMHGLALVSLFYWTLDFAGAWIRGYYHDGKLVLDFKMIARRYLKTWCVMDLSILLIEWINIILADFTESSNRLRFARIGKMLRVLSAFRVVRLARVLETFMQRCMSENVLLAISVSGVSFLFLWLNHVVSCLWFWIGTSMPSDTGKRWVELSWDECDSIPFQETPRFYQYITSFHWAVSQTTLGSMEVNPVSGWERVFNILSLFLGFLFGSTLISLLSAAMVEIQAQNRDRHQKMHTLRMYMAENRVHPAVAQQVQRQVAERLQQHLPVAASQVSALEIVSTSLLQELHFEVCRPHAMSHPILAIWAYMDVAWFRKFCHTSMQIHIFRPNDELFPAGAEALAAYYSLTGVCKYIQEPETSCVSDLTEQDVPGKSWMCESALWCHWIHVGTLEALSPCQLLLLQPESMGEVVQQHIVIGEIAREYCECFHRRIINAKPPHAPYPTDLKVPFTDQGDLVYSLSQQVQIEIGLTAIALTSSAPRAGVDKLRDEVKAGKSVVILNTQGHAERVVSLVILSLTNADGDVLYQIGDVSDGVVTPKGPILPAVKRLRSELVADALRRLSQEKLNYDGDFEVEDVESVVEEKHSKLGVHSRYLRMICHAKQTEELPGSTCHFECAGRPDTPEITEKTSDTIQAALAAGMDFFHETQITFVNAYDEEEGGSADNLGEENSTGVLYCWLSPATLQVLHTIGEAGLAKCLQHLTIPPVDRESARNPVLHSAV